MQRSYAAQVRSVPLPREAALRPDEQGAQLAEKMRALRSVLGPAYLPPPVVPLRAHIVDTEKGPRLFVELRNLSGLPLESLGIEALILGPDGREEDVMFAALSELGIGCDPRRVVPVGGWALDCLKPAGAAVVTLLFARFGDGSAWDGEIDALEDPRLPERARARASERFFAPYRGFMRAIEGVSTGDLTS